jgi:fumarate hydratase class II
MTMSSTRGQTNSFGPIATPADALSGEQTEFSRRYFAIGHQRMPTEIVHALVEIKCAAAVRVAEGGFDA